jgi:hypothetical protein
MVKKGKRFDNRTILIILLVILIIAAAFIIISNLPAEEDFLSPEEILRNKEAYLDKTISVKGFYDIDGDEDVVVSTMDTTEGRSALKLDLSGFENNETDVLRAGNKFTFTGLLKYEIENNPISDVILRVNEIDEV